MPEPKFREFDPDSPAAGTHPAVEILVHKVGRMADDMDDIKQSMKELSQNMGRLALAEERISTMNGAVERCFKAIEQMTTRISDLEKKAVTYGQAAMWVDKGIWLVLGAALTTVLVKSGVLVK